MEEKKEIVLVDTSSWIEALRASGNAVIRDRVMRFMIDGRAAWCDMVLVELWNGARGEYEKRKLSELEKEMPCLEITHDVWETARELARACRAAGRTVPAADLVIAACGISHGAIIEYLDDHFELILKIHSERKRKRS